MITALLRNLFTVVFVCISDTVNGLNLDKSKRAHFRVKCKLYLMVKF